MEAGNVARIPIQVSRNCVVASIQVDLSEGVLEQFRQDLLDLLHASGAHGVILDVAGVDILDVEDFQALRRTMAMAALMGARTVFSGFRPGVVASLVELDADLDGIVAALNLDDAFGILEAIPSAAEAVTDDEDEEEDSKRRGDSGEEATSGGPSSGQI